VLDDAGITAEGDAAREEQVSGIGKGMSGRRQPEIDETRSGGHEGLPIGVDSISEIEFRQAERSLPAGPWGRARH